MSKLTQIKVGNKVKQSDYALRSKRDDWLSQGDYTRKNAAKTAYDRAAAERGVVVEILPTDFSRGVAAGLRVQWESGVESRCLPGMVEVVKGDEMPIGVSR